MKDTNGGLDEPTKFDNVPITKRLMKKLKTADGSVPMDDLFAAVIVAIGELEARMRLHIHQTAGLRPEDDTDLDDDAAQEGP